MNIVLHSQHKARPVTFRAITFRTIPFQAAIFQASRPDRIVIEQLRSRLQQLDELVGKLTYSLREIKNFGSEQIQKPQKAVQASIRMFSLNFKK